jgi:hypothetical protein
VRPPARGVERRQPKISVLGTGPRHGLPREAGVRSRQTCAHKQSEGSH